MLMDLNSSLCEKRFNDADPVDNETELPSLVVSILTDAWREAGSYAAMHLNSNSGIEACQSLVQAAKVIDQSIRAGRRIRSERTGDGRGCSRAVRLNSNHR